VIVPKTAKMPEKASKACHDRQSDNTSIEAPCNINPPNVDVS